MNTGSFIVYIEADDICKDIAEDIEIRFDTSNYELDRPLPKGTDEKVIGLMNDIMKIVKSFEELGLLIKDVSKTIKNEAKEQKRRFLGVLLSTLGASLLGNLLKSKGTIRAGKGTVRAGENTIRAGQDF